jgi:signal transduction histidine kinase
MERSVLRGLAVFRWAAWAWMAVVLLLGRDHLRDGRAWLAVVAVAVALAVTIVDTGLLRADAGRLLRPVPVAAEVAVGIALLLLDGVVYREGHAFASEQNLGVAWPLFGVLSAGLAFGPLAGAVAGLVVGAARLGGTLANGYGFGDIAGSRWASYATTVVVYSLAGAMIGYVVGLLRRAESEIAQARAREEVARTLHDGVLQTLAVVERRTEDPDLARLAREQERDLREWLFGAVPTQATGLAPALRAAAARFEDQFGGRVQVLVADDLPPLDDQRCHALAGAVGEALTNAGKHGHASKVTVYVEPDDDTVFCSVKDDGAGFDVAGTPERVGLTRSIRGRMGDVGGRVEVASTPGRGTEVRLWLPM